MKGNIQSNLDSSRLENLLKSATNADNLLSGPLMTFTNDILWGSFERYRNDNNWSMSAKIVGSQIRNTIDKWRDHDPSNYSRPDTSDVAFLQQDVDILGSNLAKASKKIRSMNNKELLNVIKINHLYGIKSTLDYILKPVNTPRPHIRTITPLPYKALVHSISTDHLR